MSQNRDNFRANQPPSKVLHVRNLPPEATEADVLELCRPFGRVLRIKLTGGAQKSQAFAEFEHLKSALQMITYFVGNADPPRVCNKTVFLQYSTRQDIGGGTLVGVDAAGGGIPGPVLAATVECDPSAGPAIDHFHAMFSSFGEVAKIVLTDTPQGTLQALIQFADARLTSAARAALDGSPIPGYMAPSHPTPLALRVTHSPLQDLPVRSQSSRARDYSNPFVLFDETPAQQQQQQPEAAVPDGSDECTVLLAMIDDVQYTPTIEALSQVFAVYGPLAKMQLLYKAGLWQAMVQYADPSGATAAKQYLDGHAMYPGGANKITLEFSMQRDLHVPANNEYGWDWTRQDGGAGGADAAGAAAPAVADAPQGGAAAGAQAGTAGGAAAAAGAHTTAGPQAAVAQRGGADASSGGSRPPAAGSRGPIAGLTYVHAHNEVARLAAEALEPQP